MHVACTAAQLDATQAEILQQRRRIADQETLSKRLQKELLDCIQYIQVRACAYVLPTDTQHTLYCILRVQSTCIAGAQTIDWLPLSHCYTVCSCLSVQYTDHAGPYSVTSSCADLI